METACVYSKTGISKTFCSHGALPLHWDPQVDLQEIPESSYHPQKSMSQTRSKFPGMLKVLVSPSFPHTTSLVLLLKRTCENLGQEEIYSLLRSTWKAPLPSLDSSGSGLGCNQCSCHSGLAFGRSPAWLSKLGDLNSKIAPDWCPLPAFLALDDWLHDFKKAHGIWLPRKGANFRHPIYMEGGGQAISLHWNFAGGMKNLILKNI